MSEINDGGPAFPWTDNGDRLDTYTGMSLGFWFAGQAIAGSIGKATWPGQNIARCTFAEWSAIEAYTVADMLLARKQETPT